jgi:hypothetical protein
MADPLDPHDLAAIEKLAASGLWEQAGLVEARRLQNLLKKQESFDALEELLREHLEAAPPEEPGLDPSPMTEIERQLIEDVLTLFDDEGLTSEQTLSLMGQLSVLIELVKRGQTQRISQ